MDSFGDEPLGISVGQFLQQKKEHFWGQTTLNSCAIIFAVVKGKRNIFGDKVLGKSEIIFAVAEGK